MIAYFDTSAIVPLLVQEPGSDLAGRVWDEADRVVTVRLMYAEARAALAQAERLGRIDRRQLTRLVRRLDQLDGQLDKVEIDDALVRGAGELAQQLSLRGYDAIHLAAILRLEDERAVMVSGDHELCTAATTVGQPVCNTSAQ